MGTSETRIVKGYELGERLGEGGFGVVYRATQLSVDREVAMKAILPVHANDKDFIRRFENEAQLVARLEHPHIVPLFDYWREPDQAYLVMRYLRAGNLRDRMRRGRLSHEELLTILDHVASALDLAHRSGVTHRDVKPENILLDADQNAYLSDFGIAERTSARTIGQVSGSTSYMSPEQIRGERPSPRMDIYSLGIMLYEIVGGRHPYESLSARETIRNHLDTPLPALEHVPAPVNSVLLQASAKDAAARQANVMGLLHDFRAALKGRRASADEAEARAFIANPYKGLRAFTEADAAIFFGRERLVGQLLDRLREDHPLKNFLAVVGPSGSGKSSLVLAGLVPALRGHTSNEVAFAAGSTDDITRITSISAIERPAHEFILQMVPGSHPLQNLEAGLLSISSRPLPDLARRFGNDSDALRQVLAEIGGTALLVVDQFEEVFTLTESEQERFQFLELLRVAVTAADSPLRLVITLRADFTDRPLHYVDFGELMRQRTEFVLPLSAEELGRAIAEPARLAGLDVDPELIATIVHHVQGELGALPLLQYALTEAFERRTGRTITLSAYQASGGVFGALARRAQEVFDGLDPALRLIARQVFLRLVTLGEGARDTRRRVRQSELLKLGGDVQPVLDAFGKYRLIAFDVDPSTREPIVELAHEALLRAWRLLQDWLDAGRADIRLHRSLAAAVGDWERSGRDKSYLLSGSRLAQYEEWRTTAGFLLTEEESRYLDDSSARRRAEDAAEQARQRREHRRAVELHSLALTANARQTSLQNLPDIALALGVAANVIPSPPDQAAQLLFELAPMPGTRKVFTGHTDTIWTTAISADDREALSGAGGFSPASNFHNKMPTYLPLNTRSAPYSDNTMRLWEIETGGALRTFSGHENTVTAAAFAPDARHVLSGSADATVRVWDKRTGDPVRTLTQPAQVLSLAVRDDLAIVSGYDFDSATSYVTAWNWRTGEKIRSFEGQRDVIYSVAISPDGRSFLSSSGPPGPFSQSSGDNEVVLWDLASGAVRRRLRAHHDAVFHVAFCPDGRRAVSSSADASLVLWNLDDGTTLSTLRGHSTFAYNFAISPSGDRVVSASFDLSLILWDLERGQEIRRFSGHAGPVTTVQFLSDGRRVLTGAVDKTLRLWDLYSADEVRRFAAPSGLGMWAVASDGRRAVTSAGSRSLFAPQASRNPLLLWDLQTGMRLAEIGEERNTIFEAALLPNGRQLLTVSGDFFATNAENCLVLRDLADGRELARFQSPGSALSGLAVLPDGAHAATIVFGDEVAIWKIETGAIVRRFGGTVPGFRAIAVSPDGRLLLAGSATGVLTIWSLASGEILQQVQLHSLHIYEIGVSADSRLAVTVSNDTTAIVWDLEKGTEVLRFRQHAASLQALAVHPRRDWALTGDDRGNLLLWELRTGKVLRHLAGHTGGIWDIAFIDDGDLALTTAGDGNLIMWKVAPQPVEELLIWTRENRYVRDFTADERTMFRVEPLASDE